MFKFLRIASFLFIFKTAHSQIPAGYYNSAAGLTCAALKTALFNKISSNTVAVSNSNVLDAFSSTDVHRNDANTSTIIWDIYSDNPAAAEAFTYISQVNNCGSTIAGEGSCYNREHTFPQAWFGEAAPAITDLFALYPTDGYSNGQHGNYPYSEVTAPVYTSTNGSKLGTNAVAGFPTSGIGARAFEVNNAYKGDIARNYFYMVTRYESDMVAWKPNANADDVLNGTTWPSLDDWYIKLLYKWHLQDPVSQKEIKRNDAVYAIQKNRNPFIDHPEYVALIWQCTGLLPVTLIDFSAAKNNTGIKLNWTSSREENFKQYEIQRSTDAISFNNIGTIEAQNLSNYFFSDKSLPNTATVFYRLKMVDADGKFTYGKIVSVRLKLKNGGMNIFPNPAVSHVIIAFDQPLKAGSQLKVADIAGKTVINETLITTENNLKLKVSQLPAGRYFVTIINNDNLLNGSFLKTR
jgi:endonuclease I